MSVCPSARPTLTIFPSVKRGFQAFPGKSIKSRAWNLACWRILTAFTTDWIMVSVWNAPHKSCRSSCLESQIINIKLKKNQQKVPVPPQKLLASAWTPSELITLWLLVFIFLIFAQLWLSKTGQILGFCAISGEHMAWVLASCILTTFRTD